MRDGVQFTARTSIRKVGNSKGIILSGKMLSELDLNEGSEVEISLSNNKIQIVPVPQKKEINKDLSTWGNQFKAAIKAGDQPDKDPFDGLANDFDSKEW
jgi:antitoxin component of MazEF toxin-antitoxin module